MRRQKGERIHSASLLLVLFLFVMAPQTNATPPPVVRVATDCRAPVYAVDSLVCADSDLLAVDRLLADTVSRVGSGRAGDLVGLSAEEWFQHSRRCAFVSDQRSCLLASYCTRLVLLDRAVLDSVPACGGPPGIVVPAAQYSRRGLARDTAEARVLNGVQVRLSGYVDHGNLYGDVGAKAVLQERWRGEGPGPRLWRFDLKAEAEDTVGQSFAVWVPNDLLRDDVLRVLLVDARAYLPTQVWLEGRLVTSDAPSNALSLTGLRLELSGTRDIRFRPPSDVEPGGD